MINDRSETNTVVVLSMIMMTKYQTVRAQGCELSLISVDAEKFKQYAVPYLVHRSMRIIFLVPFTHMYMSYIGRDVY